MNVFMGYNPLVAEEVKITTWIKEFDGDSPVYPSFPNDGDCFVVFATDEDALTHNALSKKTYTNGEWKDADGGGGGGVSFPTFVKIDNLSTATATWQCDMTYAEVSAVYDREALGERYTDCPCKFQNRDGTAWQKMQYWTKQDLEDEGFTLDPALPSTVVGGFLIMTMTGHNVNYPCLYANDGNFYTVTSSPS